MTERHSRRELRCPAFRDLLRPLACSPVCLEGGGQGRARGTDTLAFLVLLVIKGATSQPWEPSARQERAGMRSRLEFSQGESRGARMDTAQILLPVDCKLPSSSTREEEWRRNEGSEQH